MEEEIAAFMIKVAKFEFYVINSDTNFAHINPNSGFIVGLNWTRIANKLEKKHPFADFRFEKSNFSIFRETVPQSLRLSEFGRLKWDSDELVVGSWDTLLSRGLAQLRNNIAHGNKSQMPAPFTRQRTEDFLRAGFALIDFIAREIFGDPDWETPIYFH